MIGEVTASGEIVCAFLTMVSSKVAFTSKYGVIVKRVSSSLQTPWAQFDKASV